MTQTTRRLLLLTLILAVVGLGQAADSPPMRSIERGARIAIAGHSFHVGIEWFLQRIAQAADLQEQAVVGKVFVGSSQVIQVWNVPEATNAVKRALRAGTVDVLTLSPHTLLPDPGIDKFVDLGRAANPNLRVTLQESWFPYDGDLKSVQDPDPEHKGPTDWDAKSAATLHANEAAYYRELAAQAQAINARCGKPVVFVVPTARALLALREKIRHGEAPGIQRQAELFSDRMGHPSPALLLLNTYCHYAVIYRRSPQGLPALENVKGVSPELNRLLAQLAWDTVSSEPLSGVRPAR